jgi:ferredoxin
MSVRVDRTRCHGHGRCIVIAPRVFALDDDDLSYVLEPTAGSDHEAAKRAEQACPEQAIIVDENGS